MSNDVTTILASAVRLSVPLSFAGVGEYIAERAGTLNISVEAMMLSGAYAGALGTSVSHNAAAGFAWGMAAGLLVAVIHANFSHRLQGHTLDLRLTLHVLAPGG